jgi:hypothetical protein
MDPNRTGHNKPLYITLICKDFMLAKVLIENGWTFNILSIYFLKHLLVDTSHLKPNNMMDRVYDESLSHATSVGYPTIL